MIQYGATEGDQEKMGGKTKANLVNEKSVIDYKFYNCFPIVNFFKHKGCS